MKKSDSFMQELMTKLNKAPTIPLMAERKTLRLHFQNKPITDTVEVKEKKERTRKKVIQEIYETEKSYLEQLKVLDDLYVKPIQKSYTTSSPILKEECESELFGNIRLIRDLNTKFYEDLGNCLKTEDMSIGKIFLQYLPFFKSYKIYVVNHARVQDRFHTLLLNPSTPFAKFHEENMQKPESKGLNFSSLLITPIQRVPRYKLLLQEVIKNTQPNHNDIDSLETALKLVSEVASDIDMAINAMSDRQAMLDIQEQLQGVQLVTPSRRFVRKGVLTKVGRKAAQEKRFMFFLFNDAILYAEEKGKNKYKAHRLLPIDETFGQIDVSADDEISEADIPRAFKIVNSVKSFVVLASTEAEKKEWQTALGDCISRFQASGLHRSPTMAMTKKAKPIWASDKTRDTCQICSKPWTTFRRRHHCRKCGSLVCADCSKARVLLPAAGETPAEAQKKKRICRSCESSSLLDNTRTSRGNSGDMRGMETSSSYAYGSGRPASGSMDGTSNGVSGSSAGGSSGRRSSSEYSPTHGGSQSFSFPNSSSLSVPRSQTPDTVTGSSPPSHVSNLSSVPSSRSSPNSTSIESTSSSPNSTLSADSEDRLKRPHHAKKPSEAVVESTYTKSRSSNNSLTSPDWRNFLSYSYSLPLPSKPPPPPLHPFIKCHECKLCKP